MPSLDTPSLAKAFYERFLTASDRVAFLEGLVNSSPLTFENEWLEFKTYPREDNDQKEQPENQGLLGHQFSGICQYTGRRADLGYRCPESEARSMPHVSRELAPSTRIYCERDYATLHHVATDPPISRGLPVPGSSRFQMQL